MFEDDTPVFSQEVGRVDLAEQLVELVERAGRVSEDDIVRFPAPGELRQSLGQQQPDTLRALGQARPLEIPLNNGYGIRMRVNERSGAGAAAQGFDAVGAGSCKQVEETCAVKLGRENAEQGFPDPVQGHALADPGRERGVKLLFYPAGKPHFVKQAFGR